LRKVLLALPELCTGCNRCRYACSAQKEHVFQPSLARLDVGNFPAHGYSVPLVCLQCNKPECLQACPEEAIAKNDDGVVLVFEDKCTGCGACADACPYGMIDINSMGKAYKCDHCGGDPNCVKECEPGALIFAEPDKDQMKIHGRQMKARIASGTPKAKRQQRSEKLLIEGRPHCHG
jgi:carbon-monoxide dehydrogenase iron sulfur subunit